MKWNRQQSGTHRGSRQKGSRRAAGTIWKDTAELLPVRSYDTALSCFVMKDKSCMDLYRVICSDFSSISEDDLEYRNLQMERFYRTCKCDMKLVCLNMPENCAQQKQFLLEKQNTCRNPVHREELGIKYQELEWLEKNRQQKEYYLMVFAQNAEQMREAKGNVQQGLISPRLMAGMERQEKIQAVTKLMNQEQKLFVKSVPEGTYGTIRHYGYDPYLLSAIQPAGGVRFYPAYIRSGSGYSTVLTVYDFKSELDSHWLSPLTNLGVITTVDIGTEEESNIKKIIERSFSEQKIRYTTEKKDGDQMDASRRYQELYELRRDVAEMGEAVRLLTIRIFVSAHTLEALEQRISQIQTAVETEEYHCAVCLNEQKWEWQSLLLPYTSQQMLPNRRYGQPITSHALAAGNPYHFSYLSDPHACYMGSTPMGGSFKFHLFTKTAKRLSYNALVYGMMGSGKSTLLKKLIEVNGLFGNYLRIFDPSGEYEPLVNALGGAYLNLDGSDGILNEFEIQKVDEMESICWVQHVSKLCAVYRLRREGQCSQNEINTYSKILLDFYIDAGLIPADERISNRVPITGLPAERYPTMSDFLNYINKRIQEYEPSGDRERAELGKRFLLQLDEIRNTYENLVRNYGYLLDGHTTIRQISSTQVIAFNMKTVLRLDPAVCSGVLYNALMLFWDHCIRIGTRMKNLYESGQIREEDVICSLIIFDESHHILNTRYADCVKQMTVMAREMRKYFSGIVFATQLITDNLKGDASDPEEKLVQDLFDLADYKFIGKQASSCVPVLRERFPGVFTETELFRIPRLGMGQFIVSIAEQNMEVKIFISDAERQLFAGGR